MRYELRPSGLAERVALWLGLAPLPVLDVLLPLLQVRALMAAVRLGVIDAMSEGSQSVSEIAARCALDRPTLELLLRVLASSRYVRHQRGRFGLTRLGQATLLTHAPQPLRGYVEHNYAQWSWIERLERTLQHGTGVDFHNTLAGGDEASVFYQRAMLELARPVAKILVARVPVPPNARQLIDLGGAHGLLGSALCRAHPPLRSTVIDLPAALPEARRLAQAEGISDVVSHVAGDVAHCELPGSVDIVLISNLLHHLQPSSREQLLARSFRALVPGGTLAIWETEAPAADSAPELARDALALFFRITSSTSAAHANELKSSLAEAGFQHIRLVRPPSARGRLLLHARRPRVT